MAYRPTEKTEAKKRAQLKKLSDAAFAIVCEQGFSQLTIASVAERAEVATGTIYKYFQDKSELCTHVFRRGSGREVEVVRQTAFPDRDVSKQESCKERLCRAIQSFSERAIAGRTLAYALLAEPIDTQVENERLLYRRAYAEVFEGLIQEGISKKEFIDQDARVAATAIVGALSETLVNSLEQSKELNTETAQELVQSIVQFSLRAVGSKA